MENKNYDLKLAGYIWSILKTQPVIVMSWGVDMDTIKPVKGGLEFHVQRFKHTGMVQIILDEGKDLFEVHLLTALRHDSDRKDQISKAVASRRTYDARRYVCVQRDDNIILFHHFQPVDEIF